MVADIFRLYLSRFEEELYINRKENNQINKVIHIDFSLLNNCLRISKLCLKSLGRYDG